MTNRICLLNGSFQSAFNTSTDHRKWISSHGNWIESSWRWFGQIHSAAAQFGLEQIQRQTLNQNFAQFANLVIVSVYSAPAFAPILPILPSLPSLLRTWMNKFEKDKYFHLKSNSNDCLAFYDSDNENAVSFRYSDFDLFTSNGTVFMAHIVGIVFRQRPKNKISSFVFCLLFSLMSKYFRVHKLHRRSINRRCLHDRFRRFFYFIPISCSHYRKYRV